MFKKRNLKDVIERPAHFLYHSAMVALSASVDVSLPYITDFIARKFMFFWRQRKDLLSRIGRDSAGDGAHSLFQLYSRKLERPKILPYGK